MDANQSARCWAAAEDTTRPFAFLVSTTGCAGDIRRHMGHADYSYAFVLEALTPVLERLGTWRIVDHPESRLAYMAVRAAEEGFRPVHLALHPPQNIHLSPALPTIVFPFWEFPRIPDRDFGHDTRQNWARMCSQASLIMTACQFTAEAFRRTGATCPVEVAPVPVTPVHFDVPPWDGESRWNLDCRHLIWGGSACDSAPSSVVPTVTPPASRGWNRVRGALTSRYRRHVRPWLSERAIQAIGRARRAVVRRPEMPLPLLPTAPLTLSGLVFTTIFNHSDRRKNPRDLLSAYLLAFRERPDVTLVLKLATSPAREHLELLELEALYRSLGIEHACRVVVLTDFLNDEHMLDLLRATTFYINTSHAEGACLPLQRALAAGRPVIAPDHTAMADYIDEQVGFVVRSGPEPTIWPHDPERRFETTWYRLVWSDIRDGLLQAAQIAEHDRGGYRALSDAARARMAAHAAPEVVARAWDQALTHLPDRQAGSVDWAA